MTIGQGSPLLLLLLLICLPIKLRGAGSPQALVHLVHAKESGHGCIAFLTLVAEEYLLVGDRVYERTCRLQQSFSATHKQFQNISQLARFGFF